MVSFGIKMSVTKVMAVPSAIRISPRFRAWFFPKGQTIPDIMINDMQIDCCHRNVTFYMSQSWFFIKMMK